MYIILRKIILKKKKPDITNLAPNVSLNATIKGVKGEISDITNLVTTIALTAV